MRCASCDFENPEQAKFCEECGTPFARICANCGQQARPTAKFCPECGTPLSTRGGQPGSRGAEPGAPEAERRQLTVMFCDLVGSTALSEQLDPEDLREVVRTYQQTCAAVSERYEGYIAQHLGDGALVYFGYPRAHEDDAHRAVRAGLGIVEAIQHAPRLQAQGVQVRIGIRSSPPIAVNRSGSGRGTSAGWGIGCWF